VSADPSWAVVPTYARELRAITWLLRALGYAAQEHPARQGLSFNDLGLLLRREVSASPTATGRFYRLAHKENASTSSRGVLS
jgi:hypothetical protein